MQRRILALFMMIVISVSSITIPGKSSQAATDAGRTQQVINALGIMKTDKEISTSNSVKVTRGQFAQMLVNLSSYKDTVSSKSSTSLFKDVSKNYWASGYIQKSITQGWMTGYLNGTFKPDSGVTLMVAVNAVLKVLGYTDSDFTGNITTAEMALYLSKNLNSNISKTKNQYLTKSDCINLFYNTLKATNKAGTVYGVSLGYTLDASGEIDYLSLINVEMEGPIIVKNGWMSKIPFSYKTASYYRDGVRCDFSDIEDYDVVYYSKSLKTIWAYNNKVTGTIQSISPDTLAPTSVTVAGTAYTLGASDMVYEFSTLGSIDKGDLVTLLLDKNDKVVGVENTDEYNLTVTGVVLATGEHLVTEDAGVESRNYVTLVDANGNEYQQDYTEDLNLEIGDLVRVTYQNGTATVREYQIDSALTGVFSSEGSSLDNYQMAANAKIIDVYKGKYNTIYKKRLAGITLTSASVLYYELNSQGEISQLILNNVTGDVFDYGILSNYSMSGSNITYNYIVDGKSSSVTGSRVSDYDLNIGPKGFVIANNAITATSTLTSARITSVGQSTVNISTTKYTLADEVAVFYYNDSSYNATTLSKVSNLSKYVLTAYYDKTDSEGGRVRVIVAQDTN